MKWGMPEWTFINRAPKLLNTWRQIKDPPDRSSIGALLSKTNNLTASVALLAKDVQDRKAALNTEFYLHHLLPLIPAEYAVNADKREIWHRMCSSYADSLAGINYLGQTVVLPKDTLTEFVYRFKDFEEAYRNQYMLRLNTPYPRKLSMLTKLVDIKLQYEFLQSSQAFRDLSMKTARRLERGSERGALITRLHELDALYGLIQDPPDDSDIGHYLNLPNVLAAQLYVYSYAGPGKTWLDIVSHGPQDAKLVNDLNDEFEREFTVFKQDNHLPNTVPDAAPTTTAKKPAPF